jgi:hypothetical protein
MTRLPFPFDRPLAETLRTKYLMDALRWIGDFRDPTYPNLLGAKTGNLWGVGYGLQCLLESRRVCQCGGDWPGDFDTKAQNAAHFLLDKASYGEEHCSWDDNIWDTAVICRSLLHYTNAYPACGERARMRETCSRALGWLFCQAVTHDTRRAMNNWPIWSDSLPARLFGRPVAVSWRASGQNRAPLGARSGLRLLSWSI